MLPITRHLLSSGLLLILVPVCQAALTLGDVDSLQEQNIVLNQQARAAELRQRIAQANGAGGATVATPTISGVPAPAAGERARLTGIQGQRGHLEARVHSGGHLLRLRPGQTWPGSAVTLREISLDSITLSDGTRLSPGDTYDK